MTCDHTGTTYPAQIKKAMVFIDDNVITAMIRSVLDSPQECCGFLFGSIGKMERRVSSMMEVDNVSDGDKRRTYAIHPRDYMRAEAFAIQCKLEIIGVYHSHPGHSAIASVYDRIAAQPCLSYVILSVIDRSIPDIRSWRLNDKSQFDEEPIHFNTHLLYGYCNNSHAAAEVY